VPNTSNALRRNLPKLSALSAMTAFGFSMPIIILFQQAHGLTLTQALLLQSFYSLALVICEIPSGYLADRWGRKPTIVTGAFLLSAGMLIYALSSGFIGFLIAEIILAIGGSCQSGTIEALTYDTLTALKEEKRFLKVNGLQGFCVLGGKTITSLLAGSLAAVSIILPLWVDVGLFGLAIPLSLTLQEPLRQVMKETQHLKAIWNVCTHALIRNKILQGLLLIATIVAVIDLQIFWFLQPYQEAAGLPLPLFGLTYAAMCLAGAIAYKEAHRFGQRAESMHTLIIIAIVLILACIGMGAVTSLWGLSFFIMEGIAFGLFDPIISNLINHATTSDVRATVLSLKSLAARLLFAASSPLLAFSADKFSLSYAFFLTAIFGFTALVIIYVTTGKGITRATAQ